MPPSAPKPTCSAQQALHEAASSQRGPAIEPVLRLARRSFQHAHVHERKLAIDLRDDFRGRSQLGPNGGRLRDGTPGGDVVLFVQKFRGSFQFARGGRLEAALPPGRGFGAQPSKLALPEFQHAAGCRVITIAKIAFDNLTSHGFHRGGETGVIRISLMKREQNCQSAIVLFSLIEYSAFWRR